MTSIDEAPRLSDGKFTFKNQSESPVTLEAPAPKTVTEFFEDRDEIRARKERLYEQAANLDKLTQAHSIRSIGALAIARFPGAATLKLTANLDGENNYDPVAILDKDGVVLHDAREDDDFIFEEMVQHGPTLQDLILDLNLKDDSWAADGVATITAGNKRDYKLADIDLAAAKEAPIPFIAEENSPYTRSLSENEQRDLVEAASHGVVAIDDILEDPNSFDEHRQFQEMEDLKGRVNTLLTVTKQPE